MATFLYRVGRTAYRRRWTVTLLWVVVLGAMGFAGAVAPAFEDDTFALPGIESQKARDLIEERFPGTTTDGAKARIVFIAPNGGKVTAAGNKAAVERLVGEVADGPEGAAVSNPFPAKSVSEDGTTAYTTVTFRDRAADLGDASKQHLEHAVEQARDAGLTVEVGGDALATQPSTGGNAEAIGVALAAVVLLVTFGSMTAAGLPLLSAILGVGISAAALLALGSVFGLSVTTGTLASMLGLACGIDYALFVVSRYREERAEGRAPGEAAGRAVGSAGSAVVLAGLTVVIALAGLSVVNIPTLTKMGLSAAGAVLLSVLICLTLLPALLGFWPNAVLSRTVRKRKKCEHGAARDSSAVQAHGPAEGDNAVRDNGGARWARLVTRHPLPVLLLGTVAVGALAVPAAGLQLGMPGDEARPVTTTERRAYDVLGERFGPGFNGPLTIVVDAKGAADPAHSVAVIRRKIGATDGIVSVAPAGFNEAGDTATFSAIPATSPTDAKTVGLVNAIRDERPGVEAGTGATFEVTGSTAVDIDISEKIRSALVPYLIVVVGLAIVLLLLAFRSFLVPVKAALGYLLSVLAALGAVVLVFQDGHGTALLGVEQTGPVMSLMPIFLVGIMFGLAMDYEVFLVSRIREFHVHGDGPRQAVISGFRSSARVVTAAALIMMAVFSGFLGAEDPLIKMLAFGLTAAVLLDAFVVRMTLVPAVLALLGDRAWSLPRRLDRIVPHIDVDGTRTPTLPNPSAPTAKPHQPRTPG